MKTPQTPQWQNWELQLTQTAVSGGRSTTPIFFVFVFRTDRPVLRYWPGLFHIFSLLFCLRFILKNCQLIQTKFSLNEVNYDFFSLRPRTKQLMDRYGSMDLRLRTWKPTLSLQRNRKSHKNSRNNSDLTTVQLWEAWLRLRRHYWRHYWLHNNRLYTCWKPKRPQQVMAVGLKKVVSSIAENIFTELRRKSG